eukprot:6213546-Pleurochrysis_carterae.AAC.1
MHEGEEGNEIVRGPKGRCKGKVDKPRHWARRDGNCENGCVDWRERVQTESCGVEDRGEGGAVSP